MKEHFSRRNQIQEPKMGAGWEQPEGMEGTRCLEQGDLQMTWVIEWAGAHHV